ncbi:N-acetylmuramoyl-L-alanine amidase [Streptomyces sulphureus]|uniref:N-acetylmuramoyl-L-alanine amidase n=1 Tax=Streptomyces sulphureus TaxID=47758 RepID=UPI000366DEDB|nr:N-acetylmuramoyl-L-alanine amidase [Streptomyces sulphureus]
MDDQQRRGQREEHNPAEGSDRETGDRGATGAEGRGGRAGRRAVLLGGGAAALGGLAYVSKDGLGRLWWRMPSHIKPREEGEVDDARADWDGASPSNWRQASRPDDYGIDRIVVHVVQGSYAVALKVFRDPAHGAAAHYVVRKDGHLAQAVRELDVAYHAGNRDYNQRSIGIEHEGWVDRPESFTESMYRSSARLAAGICRRYDIPADRRHIIGHIEVPGADHTDPGPHWDWDRYLHMIEQELRRGR